MTNYPLTGWPTISDKPPRHYYGIYPHTVLDTTTTPWKNRRKHLIESGIAGDDLAGREHVELYHGKEHKKINGGKSSFDPVLADLMYQWYAPHGGTAYDPFSGGITRGALAAHHGMDYLGVDLSAKQVESNQRQAESMGLNNVRWVCGDGTQHHIEDETADFVLTCPPYHSLERYSDNPNDLSAMRWEEHLQAVEKAAKHCYTALHDDRFLVWVTGDLRAPKGGLRMLPERTALILEKVGFTPVHTHVLRNEVGTRYLLARKQWTVGRVALRVDQRVLVMVKGDRQEATRLINDAYRAHHAAIGEPDQGTHPPRTYQ